MACRGASARGASRRPCGSSGSRSRRALRQRAGAERLTLETADDGRAATELVRRFGVEPQRTERGIEFPVDGGEAFLARLAGFPVEIRSLVLRKPTLEDAFIALTGKT